MNRRLLLGLGFSALASAAFAQIPFSPSNNNPTSNQGQQLRAVTPSDSANIPATRALSIGSATACNIAVVANGDTAAVTLSNVQSGQILPLTVIKVMATNTTCTGITAWY